MKKSLILVVIAAAVISTSCRKDRTCTCTTSITDTIASGGATTTVASTGSTTDTEKSVKKSYAKLAGCYDRTETEVFTGGGGGAGAYTDTKVTVFTCTLK
jgi:hypothetical protein